MAKPKINMDYVNGIIKDNFGPGKVAVSWGNRGGGKTHSAIAICENLINGVYPDMPKHIILATNVIFVRKDGAEQFTTASPPGVYTITTLRDFFPIVSDALTKYGRKDLLVILLLDEAQNFLLGDNNNVGDMAKSMKAYAGILRKTNTMLWFISPTMKNLGPAFRNFLISDTVSGNVTVTFQKNNQKAAKYIKARKLDMDPRSILFVKEGENELSKMMPVPDSTWTADPDTLKIGEYAYDNLASADFKIGDDFPFADFIYAISGRSSYEMVKAINDFYDGLGLGSEGGDADVAAPPVDHEAEKRAVQDCKNEMVARMYDLGFQRKAMAELFDVSTKTINNWYNAYIQSHPDYSPKRKISSE